MEDRLATLMSWFELRARVFQTGPLCRSSAYDARDGLSYIHVLREGVLRVETRGEASRTLDRPSLILYMQPTPHRLIPQGEGASLVCASFEFGDGLRNPLIRALPRMVLLELEQVPTLAPTLELLFEEALDEHCGRQSILDRLSEVVIILLLRDLMDQERLTFGLLAGLSDPQLAKAINAIHREPAHHWSLEKLAQVAGMSRARFAVRFRETVGSTPVSYLSEWRLGIAKTLLTRGKPMQQIAYEVGYANASALARAFSAHTGLSPRDWLKSEQQGHLQ